VSSTAQSAIAGNKPPGGLARRSEAKCRIVGLSLYCAKAVGYGGSGLSETQLQEQLHTCLEYPLQESAEHAYEFLRDHGSLETMKSLLELTQGKWAHEIDQNYLRFRRKLARLCVSLAREHQGTGLPWFANTIPRCRTKWKAQHGVRLFVVDSAPAMAPPSTNSTMSTLFCKVAPHGAVEKIR
jgi:hypothetical protein